LVEPPAHNRSVPGSSPGEPTNFKKMEKIIDNNQILAKRLEERDMKECPVKGIFFVYRKDDN